MENQILLDVTSLIDSGLVTEILGQNSSVPAENFHLGAAVIDNPTEEGLLCCQDAVDVGETLLDHKYSLTAENQKAIVKAEVYLHGNNNRDDEDLEKYKELNLPEEAEHVHSPYLPSDGVHFLSSVAMQHKNCSVPTSSIFPPEGTVNPNVGTIPVSRSFMPAVTEPSGDTCGLPQTSAALCDEIVVCQLEGGTQMLCINSCGTEELKPLHLVPEYDNQQDDLPSDVDNAATAVLGRFLPVLCEVVRNKPELENGPLQPVTSAATLPEESNLHGTVNVASEGSFLNKRQMQPQCERYCDFFANGDFCNNRNCNNCYNSQLHEAERFKAIKELFEPKFNFRTFFSLEGKFVVSQHQTVAKGKQIITVQMVILTDRSAVLVFLLDPCSNARSALLAATPNPAVVRNRAKLALESLNSCSRMPWKTPSSTSDKSGKNPEAFLPKIEKGKLGEISPHHHNKGCNCKHTGCLENYCECFEAKIMCSSICKCIGCKNYEENGSKVLNYVDIGKTEGNSPVLTSTLETLPTLRQPAVCISLEEVKAVCTSLLMQAEEAEKKRLLWLAG